MKAEHSRLGNLVRVKKLSKHDVLYRWPKPKGKPDTFDRDEFNALPDEMLIRLMKVRVEQPGFRTVQFDVLATLTDHQLYSTADLARLYRRRWQAELFIRDIKATLGMDELKCKTPAMVRKEIYAYLVAYNLVRIRMAQAAHLADILPEQISFTSSLCTIVQFQDQFQEMSPHVLAVMLAILAQRRVGKQPDRHEPRAVKRRCRHALLTKPRSQARNDMRENDLRVST